MTLCYVHLLPGFALLNISEGTNVHLITNTIGQSTGRTLCKFIRSTGVYVAPVHSVVWTSSCQWRYAMVKDRFLCINCNVAESLLEKCWWCSIEQVCQGKCVKRLEQSNGRDSAPHNNVHVYLILWLCPVQ